jgi:hypothetical protein
MPKQQRLTHVAMSVPAGTLTDEFRARVLDFYGRVFGWHEMEALRRPDRLTIAVGASYINVRERADADDGDVTLEPIAESADGLATFRLRYLLPLTVEAQYFPG